MNKTVTVNLNGIVYQIEESAYNKLNGYLNAIRQRLENTEGRDEILADIEARIAELFSEMTSAKKQVITLEDVESVIETMGKPEDFDTGDEDARADAPRVKRRLYRNPDDRVLGGVCSGISAYLGIDDPIWLRLLFVAAFIFFGSGVLLYLILWIIIPEAKTPSQKLEMRGEPVTIASIEKAVREEYEKLKEQFSEEKTPRQSNALQRVISLIIEIVKLALRVAVRVLAVLLIIAGASCLFGSLFFILLPAGYAFRDFAALIFQNGWQLFFALLGLVLLCIVPAVGLVYAGLRILIGKRARIPAMVPSLVVAGFMGLLACVISVATVASDFSRKSVVQYTYPLSIMPADTLIVQAENTEIPECDYDYIDCEDIAILASEGIVQLKGNIHLDIRKTDGENPFIEQTLSARGSSREEARMRAELIRHDIEINENHVTLSDAISFPDSTGWRNQKANIILYLKPGNIIYLDHSLESLLYDVDNIHNMWDGDMVGHYWQMTGRGLQCLDCNESDRDTSDGNFVTIGNRNFDRIRINGIARVTITQGEDYEVALRGDERALKSVDVEQRGDVLEIDVNRKIKIFDNDDEVWNNFQIDIQLPELQSVELNGMSRASIRDIDASRLKVEIAGAGKANISGKIDELVLEVYGASHVDISGTGKRFEAGVSGASHLNSKQFIVEEVNIDLSGASRAEIYAARLLRGEVSGASHLHYRGNPHTDIEVSGFSSVKPDESL